MAIVATLHNDVYDAGLTGLYNLSGTADLYLCSTQPTTYAEASSTYALANKANVTITAPEAATSGRKVTISAISGGTVTGNGTAAFWALTDGTSKILCVQDLGATQVVTSGNTWSTSAAIDINIPAPTA